MARRKRKEDEPEWTPPEFDDVGYMRKEIEGAKIAVVTIAWAFVGAGIAVLLYDYVHPVVGFFLGLMAFGALYFILPMLGLPIAGFKRRDWMSHGTIYFFSWIAFWILLLNPPFADHTPPTLSAIEVGPFTPSTNSTPAPGSVVCAGAAPDSGLTLTTGSNSSLFVTFRATDNVQVSRVNVSLVFGNSNTTSYPTLLLVTGEPNRCQGQAGPYPGGTYSFVVPITGSSFHAVLSAWDSAGLSATGSLDVTTRP